MCPFWFLRYAIEQPQNVLLQSSSYNVKIADFGLAKGGDATATRGVGTPAYMPPEMFNEVEHVENVFAIDVYALSMIMYGDG